MCFHHSARALIGAAFLAGTLLVAGQIVAAPNDYRFELVQAEPAGPGKNQRHGASRACAGHQSGCRRGAVRD